MEEALRSKIRKDEEKESSRRGQNTERSTAIRWRRNSGRIAQNYKQDMERRTREDTKRIENRYSNIPIHKKGEIHDARNYRGI